MKTNRRKTLLVGLALVLGIVGTVLWLRREGARQAEPSDAIFYARMKGPRSAAVHILEFSDFQCPACRSAQPVLEGLLKKYPGRAALIFRHFPLEAHTWAELAHQAAECAGEQGNFWDYHDLLFENQAAWSGSASPAETFLGYAKNLGFHLDRFASCLTDEKIKRRIERDRKEGLRLKLSSTPTFFIGRERIVGGAQLAARGERVLEQALSGPERG